MWRQALGGTNPFASSTRFHSNQFEDARTPTGRTSIYLKDELALARCSSRTKEEHRINWARISRHAGKAAACNNVTLRRKPLDGIFAHHTGTPSS